MVMVYLARCGVWLDAEEVRHKMNGSSDAESEEGPVQIPGVSMSETGLLFPPWLCSCMLALMFHTGVPYRVSTDKARARV